MIVNNLTRNELLAKVYMRVLKEDQRMDTQHILWDWMCSATSFIKWLCSYNNNGDSFHIAIRKSGLEAGEEGFVNKQCEVLSGEYIRIKITWQDGNDFTIEIN